MKRPTAALAVFVVFVVGLTLGGCSKEGESGGSGSAAGDGKSVPPALLEKWKKASLTVSAFTDDKSGKIGTLCQSGTVSGVDVVWCAFPAEADTKAAEPKGLEWVGEATGTALVSGKQLLAVVDRRAADPSGRTINAVTKAFR